MEALRFLAVEILLINGRTVFLIAESIGSEEETMIFCGGGKTMRVVTRTIEAIAIVKL